MARGDAATQKNIRAVDPEPVSKSKAFGNALKVARMQAMMIQNDLAEAMDVHPSSVSQWERGDRADVPKIDIVRKLDDLLEAHGRLLVAAGYREEVEDEDEGEDSKIVVVTADDINALRLPDGLTPYDVSLLAMIANGLATRNLANGGRQSSG